MELVDAIVGRRSIRAFRPDPVPREVLGQIMQISQRAPSWMNTQPWEFAIVGGQEMARLKKALLEAASQNPHLQPDISMPLFSDPYNQRRRELGYQVYKVMGIGQEDKEKRIAWFLKGVEFFDAPNAIIPYIDRSLSTWSLLDVGLISMLVMLAAQEFDLGTCIETEPSGYPQVVREVLGIPDSKIILASIAIGYPDWDAPINRFRSSRETVESFVRWHGID